MTIEGLPHLDDDSYEYAADDGTLVTVRVDERRNGGRIGAYHYAADGSRMAYWRFRIHNVENRLVNCVRDVSAESVTDAVLAALASGGWRMTNGYPAALDDEDPEIVVLLDVADMFEMLSQHADAVGLPEWFRYFALTARLTAVHTALMKAADAQDVDLDEITREQTQGELDEVDQETLFFANLELAVEGGLENVGDHLTYQHQELLDARTLYRGGEDWYDALWTALGIVGDPEADDG